MKACAHALMWFVKCSEPADGLKSCVVRMIGGRAFAGGPLPASVACRFMSGASASLRRSRPVDLPGHKDGGRSQQGCGRCCTRARR